MRAAGSLGPIGFVPDDIIGSHWHCCQVMSSYLNGMSSSDLQWCNVIICVLAQGSGVGTIIVRSPFRAKHHVAVQYMARWMKCPLPP